MLVQIFLFYYNFNKFIFNIFKGQRVDMNLHIKQIQEKKTKQILDRKKTGYLFINFNNLQLSVEFFWYPCPKYRGNDKTSTKQATSYMSEFLSEKNLGK